MSGYTPGPWEWRDRSGAGLEIMAPVLRIAEAKGAANPSAPAMSPIFDMQSGEGLQYVTAYEIWTRFSPAWWGEMQKANARLISAAPDLLGACEMAIQTLIVSCRPAGNPDVDDAAEIRGMVSTLRAAISKATGDTP